jgi:hypothetical protein
VGTETSLSIPLIIPSTSLFVGKATEKNTNDFPIPQRRSWPSDVQT